MSILNKELRKAKAENRELKEKNAEYLAGWQRSKADFENYRRQQEEWAKNLRINIKDDFLQEIFPVLDNFNLALEHIPADEKTQTWLLGLSQIKKQLEILLENSSVKKIATQPGDSFDPHIHEAIEEKKISNEEKGTSQNQKNILRVEKVLRDGYSLDGKILRPTQVSVQ